MTTSIKNIELAKEKLINRTNVKIENWYETAKEDYNIDGSGVAKIEGNEFIVDYIEDGVKKTWSTCFYDEYLQTESINYFYDCWSELA